MKTLAETLRDKIGDLGYQDVKECARKLDIPYELFRKVLSDGHLPKDKTLMLYAEKLGLDSAELIAAVYQEKAPQHVKHLLKALPKPAPKPVSVPKGQTMAPVMGKAACGEWLESYPVEPDHYEPVEPGDDESFFVVAEGESMIGGNIPPGAYLLVSPGSRVSNGNIVLARRGEEEFTVKVYYRQSNGAVLLQPMNPAFEPMLLGPEEPLNVLRITEVRLKV